MSCETLSQGSTGLQVSMASLPEGFCPASMQELANAIAERLIVSPNQSFTSFATGSIEPSSNVGPWFKDCLELFVFDDTTARYIPITKGGFNSLQVIDSTSSFIVPDSIYKIMVEGYGAGGGGANSGGGSSSPGGGGGGYGLIIRAVTPGQAIPITIGTAGVAGTPGTNGGDTTVLGMTCGGGVGGNQATFPGTGGIVTGSDMSISGGGGERGGAAGGSGGDSPKGGPGGVADVAGGTNVTGTLPGGAGAGGTISNANGGSGANGRVVIWF